jgi:hypothetical protein
MATVPINAAPCDCLAGGGVLEMALGLYTTAHQRAGLESGRALTGSGACCEVANQQKKISKRLRQKNTMLPGFMRALATLL